MKKWESIIEYATRKNKSRQHIYDLVERGDIEHKIFKKIIKIIKVR